MESYGTEIEEGTCREFVADIKVGGRTEKGVGISCQQADGSWKIQQQPVFITECPDGTRNNYKGECVAVDGGTATGGLSGPSTDPKDL